MTSKTEANGPTHAITQHPSLASGQGPCVTADEVENVNRSQCLVMQREVYEACQTASLCPFVWVVFFWEGVSCYFGGHGALACDSTSGAEIFIHIHVLETQDATISNLDAFRIQTLVCHVRLVYVKVRTRSDLHNAVLCKM